MPIAEKIEDETTQQVVYAISHDLRAPTRHLNAYVEILTQHLQGELDSEAAEYLARITDAASVFESRLKALEDFSRVITRGAELQPCSLGEAVAEAINTLDDGIADRAALVSVDPLPVVLADWEQIVRVFHELIDNSLKFGAEGPVIRIESQLDEHDHVILVSDNGPGFTADNRQQAFDLFKRFHPASIPGTGIGLAVVRRIVERHGGSVEIAEHDSDGAQVILRLPKDLRALKVA